MLKRTAKFVASSTIVKGLLALICLGGLTATVTWLELPSLDTIRHDVQEHPHWPRLYDRHGRPLGPHPQGGYPLRDVQYGGTYTRYDELPKCAVDFIEELEGYSPLGPKLWSFPKCLGEAITGELRGCSSVDMQNARNLYFAGAREDSLDEEGYSRRAFVARLWRKWTETVTAMKMAWTLPPARRLELYFNMSTFLSQRRGIGYATARLFGKRPRETTCRQYLQAFSLLQRPAALYRDRDAFLGYYREKLSHLYEEGLISAKQYEAWHDPPPFEWHTWGETSHAAARDRAVREAHQILKGTSHRLSEGLTVVTSVDADLQVRTDSVLEARIERWPGAIGSFLLLKPNGFFRTYVVTSAGTQGDLDFITATEQPGSRIKIALYLLAVAHLHEQGYSAEDIFTYELPTRYVLREDGETKTIGSHCTKHGDSVDLHRAFAESCNGAAYAVANELLTPKVVSRFLAQFGIEVKSHEAIAMGSFSVSEEQLAELHNALINAYRYVPARIVERIQTRDGTVIYEAPREPQAADRHAIAPEVAWVVRHLMRETVRSGTATRLCNGLPDCAALGVGAKTGSSNGRVRRWRGVTGQIGWRGGMTMSLSLRADGPMPLSPHSAVPVAGGVLHTLKPLFE